MHRQQCALHGCGTCVPGRRTREFESLVLSKSGARGAHTCVSYCASWTGCHPAAGASGLAAAMMTATTSQWLLQTLSLHSFGVVGSFRWRGSAAEEAHMRRIAAVAIPAALSSIALSAVAFTDLLFASFIPGVARRRETPVSFSLRRRPGAAMG